MIRKAQKFYVSCLGDSNYRIFLDHFFKCKTIKKVKRSKNKSQ